jgi:glutaredoxin
MKKVIVYSMKGCPHCAHLKKSLTENKVKFIERDVDEYNNEYEKFVEVTKNQYLPAFVLLNTENKTLERMAPDRDFNTIEEATEKIKKFIL